jgi:tetracycline 7-halogenase / FADH2 O2-dependent halogenase
MKKTFDFLIAGSGFGGSILAMCLAQSGYEVCMVERGSHPRFAVGESSTPIADMILRDLSEQYDLPFLKEISRYGEWQKHHPKMVCGLKRGFSYYPHSPGKLFASDLKHKNELLVAASTDDDNSDTNWLRSDVDSFLIQQVKRHGIENFEMTEITEAAREGSLWHVLLESKENGNGFKQRCNARWIIDATGSAAFSGKFFRTRSSASAFHTNSSAIYSHFEGAGRWFNYLKKNGFHTDDYPYNPDHSALHHLIEEGWIWMLRFNNDLLSAGIVLDNNNLNGKSIHDPESIWNQIISKYPSLKQLFANAEQANVPGKLIQSGRLQRRLDSLYGVGWVALNHTAGFVDPLHSTGIAHTLSGVEKLAGLFSASRNDGAIYRKLEKLEHIFFQELELIDLMVSSCYLTNTRFELFTAAVMLYFAASVTYEKNRLKGDIPDAFLCANQPELIFTIKRFQEEFSRMNGIGEYSESAVNHLIRDIKQAIEPFNDAGLMEPARNNMYHHTAITL